MSDNETFLPSMNKKQKEGPVEIVFGEHLHLHFKEGCFKRILMIHWLESSSNPQKSLRDAWNVLEEEGSLLLFVPNRHSLWARKDKTPFGRGTSFTFLEIKELLEGAFFTNLTIKECLYMPPISSPIVQSLLPVIERLGKIKWIHFIGFFAGLWVIEASKRTCRPLPQNVASLKEASLVSVLP